jgi:4-carboxymuconolactone decarboxylase
MLAMNAAFRRANAHVNDSSHFVSLRISDGTYYESRRLYSRAQRLDQGDCVFKRHCAFRVLVFMCCLGAVMIANSAPDSFSHRPTTPRLAPLGAENRTEAQSKMLASRPDYNIYKTLAHHPDLYARWSPLGQFLLNGSSLPPREREIVMLRMGWLCQSEYEWSQHARIAKSSAGMSDEEVHRIAEGPDAAGWSDFERALLRMVDELRYDTMISDATWQALRTKYSDQQIMESLFTAAQYQLVSMALNSLGVQLDPELDDRLPKDVPLPKLASRPETPRLTQPRIKALRLSEMTAEQRELVAPQVRNGELLNLYATIASHPQLYGPRVRFGSYLQRDSLLPPKTRELLILSTAWLIRAEYEWAHHVESAKAAGFRDAEIARIPQGPDADGWSEEHRALLTAADELRREAFITDATWNMLAKHYDTKQLVEIIYTVGGYAMTGLAINSFGIQVEPGYPAMPQH